MKMEARKLTTDQTQKLKQRDKKIHFHEIIQRNNLTGEIKNEEDNLKRVEKFRKDNPQCAVKINL